MQRFLKNNSNIWLIFFAAAVGFTVVSYQNCAPSTGGSAFQIGMGSAGSSSTSSTISISPISLNQTSFTPGATITASAGVTSTSSITCQWTITTSANVLVSSPAANPASDFCSLNIAAPTTAGSYILTLLVIGANQSSAQSNAAFQVGSGPTPIPLPTPIATPAPVKTPVPTPASCLPLGDQCNQFTVGSPPSTGSCNSCCHGYSQSCTNFGSVTVCTDKCD